VVSSRRACKQSDRVTSLLERVAGPDSADAELAAMRLSNVALQHDHLVAIMALLGKVRALQVIEALEMVLIANAERSLPLALACAKASEVEQQARISSLRVVSDVADSAIRDELYPLLEDHDARIREESALALGRLGDLRAIATLRGLLEADNYDTRIRAWEALAHVGVDVPDPTAE